MTETDFQNIGEIADKIVTKADPYRYWQKALEMSDGRELTREQQTSLGVHDGHPECGFYRKRNKGKKDTVVAIWRDERGLVALEGEDPVDPSEAWSFCSRWPISYETYEAVAKGAPWPDDPPSAVSLVGHNMPDDPHEAAKLEFEGEKEIAQDFLKKPITTQQQADQAAVWAKKLNDLHGKVDRMFRAKKDPIVQAGREVDEEFRWRQDIKDLATALKRHQDEWLREQERLERERQRKAREEAERKAREAEEAAKKAGADAAAKAEAERKAHEAAIAEREAQARKVQSGRTGAKVSLRTYVFARIVDYDKALASLRDHPDMRALVEQLANRAVKAGVHVDGVERCEEKRAA